MQLTNTAPELTTLTAALAEPFSSTEVRFKPQSVRGNRALALAYIDCRVVQDRLDDVLGVDGWMDEYQVLPDGSVVCKLQLRLGNQWVIKTDVGSMSEQPDGGDRMKAAFSDALKRAAVKFGVGRYLYRLPAVWADYDPVKKQFVQPPALPVPAARTRAVATPKPAAVRPVRPPASGAEMHERLRKRDAELAQAHRCQVGALLTHVTQAAVAKGYGDDMTRWDAPALALATEAARSFIEGLKTSESQPAA